MHERLGAFWAFHREAFQLDLLYEVRLQALFMENVLAAIEWVGIALVETSFA